MVKNEANRHLDILIEAEAVRRETMSERESLEHLTRTQIAQINTTPIEAAHARGLKEGRIQGRARFWWLLERKNALGIRYRSAVGRKRQLEHENALLKELLTEALPNLDGYVIMVADQPGSLWARIHAALSKR